MGWWKDRQTYSRKRKPKHGKCGYCGTVMVDIRRGLCRRHYNDETIRERHGDRSRLSCASAQGEPEGVADPPLPKTPTQHLPGSEGKIAVLIERFGRCSLWHPEDYKGE